METARLPPPMSIRGHDYQVSPLASWPRFARRRWRLTRLDNQRTHTVTWLRSGVLICDCEAWKYSPSSNRSCKHTDWIGEAMRSLGMVEDPDDAA